MVDVEKPRFLVGNSNLQMMGFLKTIDHVDCRWARREAKEAEAVVELQSRRQHQTIAVQPGLSAALLFRITNGGGIQPYPAGGNLSKPLPEEYLRNGRRVGPRDQRGKAFWEGWIYPTKQAEGRFKSLSFQVSCLTTA